MFLQRCRKWGSETLYEGVLNDNEQQRFQALIGLEKSCLKSISTEFLDSLDKLGFERFSDLSRASFNRFAHVSSICYPKVCY